MPRYKKFLDQDVLEAARERVRHIFDIFDTVIVSFSGGKDSLVCLHLVKEVHEERGLGPVRALFYDEELISDPVIELVKFYRDQPWLQLDWYAIPLRGDKFVLGKSTDYIQWDPDRPHIRDAPPWSITLKDLGLPDRTVMTQYDLNVKAVEKLLGSVAVVIGIRAAESLTRYRSVVNKLNENYICALTGTAKAKGCKPIYDWSENDIFKYIGENKIRYCALYENQRLAGSGLRVATPLHSESAKRIHLWRTMDPDFYNRLLAVFPEMELQDRYWQEFDRKAEIRGYEESWAGCAKYIEDHFHDESKVAALKRLHEFTVMSVRKPQYFSPAILLKKLAGGTVKRVIF